MNEITIEGKKIGEDQSVYFIAEAGVNHEGDRNLARALTEIAVWAGADALKVQTFKADLIVTQGAEKAAYQQENLGNEDSQYEMLKKLELDESGHEFLQGVCQKSGVTFMSTPHSDFWSVDYLDSLGVPAFKVGSGDLTNIPILKYIARKNKPIVISTGMGTLEEIEEAIDTIKGEGNEQVVVLHCTTNYPCPMDDVNLKAMQSIRDKFGVLVGYSDHTQGVEVPIMATALGATIIEKHYTIDPAMKGNSPDHSSSLSPGEIKEVIEAIKFTRESGVTDPIEAVNNYRQHAGLQDEQGRYTKQELESALGDGIKQPTKSEITIKPGVRKSLVATREIAPGEKFTPENISIKRPEGGLHPREYERIIGEATASKKINLDELITEENSK